MSNKSLAQLEIGSPEWIAKRQSLIGPQPQPTAQMQPGLLAIGALAVVVGAVFVTAARLGALVARRH